MNHLDVVSGARGAHPLAAGLVGARLGRDALQDLPRAPPQAIQAATLTVIGAPTRLVTAMLIPRQARRVRPGQARRRQLALDDVGSWACASNAPSDTATSSADVNTAVTGPTPGLPPDPTAAPVLTDNPFGDFPTYVA